MAARRPHVPLESKRGAAFGFRFGANYGPSVGNTGFGYKASGSDDSNGGKAAAVGISVKTKQDDKLDPGDEK